MKYTLVIATNNAHKIEEIQEILADFSLPIVSYREVFDEVVEVVEDGETFEENAIKKVSVFPDRPGLIYLAEDSGIEVDYLDGRPGIYSARYAGPNATKEQMCHKLLGELYGAGDRSARYRACMAVRFPGNRIETCEGRFEGSIAYEMLGDNGFGYDPVFIPEDYDQTCGELPIEVKHSLSHRFKALQQVRGLLKEAI